MARPTPEQHAALAAFAAKYGRCWKQYLMAAWLSYSYRGTHMGGQDSGTLREIRNQFGPSWLVSYRPPKAIGHSTELRGQTDMTRAEFDARFAATEENTDWQLTRQQLAAVNEVAFAAVQCLDVDDDRAKSAADHALGIAIGDLPTE